MIRKGDRYTRVQTGETFEVVTFGVIDTRGSAKYGAPVVTCQCVETGRELTVLRDLLNTAAFRRVRSDVAAA